MDHTKEFCRPQRQDSSDSTSSTESLWARKWGAADREPWTEEMEDERVAEMMSSMIKRVSGNPASCTSSFRDPIAPRGQSSKASMSPRSMTPRTFVKEERPQSAEVDCRHMMSSSALPRKGDWDLSGWAAHPLYEIQPLTAGKSSGKQSKMGRFRSIFSRSD